MQNLLTPIKKIFTLDLRSLAILRISLGALILLDLSIRASDLKAFYSDEGVLPLKALFMHSWNLWDLSIHTISGLWQIQALLFIIAAIFAIFLLFGYKTQLSSIICWFFMLSLHNRNPLILQGGDDMLRMILFWGIFLPWGKFYSIDTFGKPEPHQKHVVNVATVGYILQLLSVYFFAALLKTSPEWISEGTAIYYALSLDQMVFPVGKIIYPYPDVLKFLTHFVWYMELLAPLMFLIPIKQNFFRKAGILSIIFLHTGIAVTLFVGLFFIIGIVTLCGTIPEEWAERIHKSTYQIRVALAKFYEKFLSFKRKYFHITFNFETSIKKYRIYSVSRNGALTFIILYTFFWNFHTTSYPIINFNQFSTDFIGQFFKIRQKWGMFSPCVFKDDGWYILEATTYNGDLIDINRNGMPVDYSKPASVVSLFKNDRWRKYGENCIFANNSFMRPYYCEFMFNEWNKGNPSNRIKGLKVIYMMERTLPDYKYVEPVREELATISE